MPAPIKVFNQSFSCQGPLVLPVDLDFTNSQNYTLDLTDFLSQGYMDYISSVYVDMSLVTTFDITLVSHDLPQKIFAKRGTISYMPIMLSNWPKIDASVSAPLNGTFRILVSNIPFFPFIQTV